MAKCYKYALDTVNIVLKVKTMLAEINSQISTLLGGFSRLGVHFTNSGLW